MAEKRMAETARPGRRGSTKRVSQNGARARPARKTRLSGKTTRRKSGASELGQEIIAGLKEVLAYTRGEMKLTVIEIPDPIPPVRIKAIRKKAAKSVRLFSEKFGLPANTVRQWEQGERRPDAASSLLLEVIDANPQVVEAAARRRQSVG